MLTIYVIGCAVMAVLRGFNTPLEDTNRLGYVFSVAAVLTWPLLLLLGLGSALRMFSAKKSAEDGGEPWASRP